MSRSLLVPVAICAVGQLLSITAFAQALPLKTSLKLGRPAQAIEATFSETDTLQLTLKSASLKLPARGVKTVTAESIAVAENVGVAVVHVAADNGRWVALVGGRTGQELLFVGREDPVGDPGEKRAARVEVTPARDGRDAVISVATQFEGVTHCGADTPVLVEQQVVDAKTAKLTAKRSLPTPGMELVSLTATPVEAPAERSALQALSAVASNQLDPNTGTLQVPRALVDGANESSWQAQPGDLALLRWSASSLPIERLTLQLVGRGPKDRPATLLVMAEGGAFRVALPKATGSDRYEVTLPAPLRTRCLSVALEPTSETPSSTLNLAELRAGTSLDRPEGLPQLVSQLVQDGENGAAAAELLAQLGVPAAQAVAARFDELSVRGQRRALRVLAVALQLPEVRARVLQAARNSDPHLSEAAFVTLSRGKQAGLEGLRELVVGGDPAADVAARGLTTVSPSEASALLSALSAANGTERPTLRRALVAVARRDVASFRAASDAWLASSPTAGARIVFSLIALNADLAELATKVAEGALADTQSFDDRFRLGTIAGQLQASAPLDGWLAQQATASEEWMVRRAAYDSLVKRGSPNARTMAEQIAKDPYPRVRASAASELAKAGKQAPLESSARDDHWPLVRAAATTALGTLKDTRPILETQLDDVSRRVRAAAVDALGAQGSQAAWPLVEQRLTAANEWPEVQAAAIRFATSLCMQEARAALTQTARRGLRPDANEDERQLSLEAIHALHDLGGAAANDAKLLATRESSSPQLQEAITRFAPSRCAAKAR